MFGKLLCWRANWARDNMCSVDVKAYRSFQHETRRRFARRTKRDAACRKRLMIDVGFPPKAFGGAETKLDDETLRLGGASLCRRKRVGDTLVAEKKKRVSS